MRSKKMKIFGITMAIAAAALFVRYKTKQFNPQGDITKEIKPFIGSIRSVISTTGTVMPKNRLEIKPPVNGRVEEILVKEGEAVKTGRILAWMSSTERAALLDAAAGKSEKDLQYWKEVYKAIPLISPIDGEVIVAKTQPGQTVTASDAIIVLSDQLIVRAQVDETDIGKIKLGQDAVIVLDAYPDDKISAKTGHIYYESKTENNVTIYEVDLVPESIPLFFRSGMNAAVNFIEKTKNDALLIPSEALIREKNLAFVMIKQPDTREAVKREVELGMSDDKNTEIVSGIGAGDVVILKNKKYELPKNNIGVNPFMPFRRRDK